MVSDKYNPTRVNTFFDESESEVYESDIGSTLVSDKHKPTQVNQFFDESEVDESEVDESDTSRLYFLIILNCLNFIISPLESITHAPNVSCRRNSNLHLTNIVRG